MTIIDADDYVGQQVRISETDALKALGITELRKLSKGKFSGGYSMKKDVLVEALYDAGVRIPAEPAEPWLDEETQ